MFIFRAAESVDIEPAFLGSREESVLLPISDIVSLAYSVCFIFLGIII